MNLTTYAGLQEAIASYLGQDNLTASIPTFITIAESRAARRIKVRDAETTWTGTVTAGNATIALPSTYRGFRSVHIDGDPVYQLESVTPEQLYQFSTAEGRPKVFSVIGTNMTFPADSDGTYVVKGVMYTAPESISTDTTGTFFTTRAPELLLYGSLQAAAEFIQDDAQAQKWGALFDQALSELQYEANREKYGPIPVARTEGARW
jgi:hypothetical protein